MATEFFVGRDFKPESKALIRACNRVIEEYQAMGFVLTLRQLYYQMVAKAIIPNTVQSYKRLGSIVNDARLAGKMDWDAIEDRTRNVRAPSAWESPEDIMQAIADQYAENPWLEQDHAPEVWIEKDALVGVIEPVCRKMRVPYFACRGYTSQSEAYSAGKRFARVRKGGRVPIVLHLGDHDPSGIDMTRDNADRMAMFARHGVQVRRLALNMEQVEEYNPPPNPAKQTDSRFEAYQEEHGDSSWELDALPPDVIDSLIQDELDTLVDEMRWEATMEREKAAKDALQQITDRWDEVVEFLKGDDDAYAQ
jgi:hypothetical protein